MLFSQYSIALWRLPAVSLRWLGRGLLLLQREIDNGHVERMKDEKENEFWGNERTSTASDKSEAAGPSLQAFADDSSLSSLDVHTSIEVGEDAPNSG
jgi:hypothetical protein